MKITAINASSRNDGNTYKAIQKLIMDKFKSEDSKIYHLSQMNINHCKGDYVCEKLGYCHQEDDFSDLQFRLKESEVVIVGTPVYMGRESGLLKNLVDRFRSFLFYIDLIDPSCSSIEELFSKHSNLRNDWPEPKSRILNKPKIYVIITQSQPDKNKYLYLKEYMRKIFSKIFNTDLIEVIVYPSMLEKKDFELMYGLI